jgi:propanol-preferring alcohol dehydrogenase
MNSWVLTPIVFLAKVMRTSVAGRMSLDLCGNQNIFFAPAGSLVPAALQATVKGGTVVCGGIHMSDIPSFPYQLLWAERALRSAVNLTRADGEELIALAARIPVKTEVEVFPLSSANQALDCLRRGRLQGAAVLRVAEA